MEVLQLKCGVSVNKMVLNESNTDKQWVEVRNFCRLKIKSPPKKKKIVSVPVHKYYFTWWVPEKEWYFSQLADLKDIKSFGAISP